MADSVLIFGTGQLANAVASIIEVDSELTVAGFVDDNPEQWGASIRGYECLGGRSVFAERPDCGVVLAVGQVDAKRAIGDWLDAEGIRQVSVIHPTAVLPVDCAIGEGSIINAGAVVYINADLGRCVFVGPGAIISHDTVVGDYALVSAGAVVGARVDIESGGFVGAGATVMPAGWGAASRLRIGTNAVVGAGTVVLSDVEDRSVVFGVPARHLRYREVPAADASAQNTESEPSDNSDVDTQPDSRDVDTQPDNSDVDSDTQPDNSNVDTQPDSRNDSRR